jgi:arsenite methyltransferase
METGTGLNVISESCCTTEAPSTLHDDLTELLTMYDVNAAAASVKVYAIKPGSSSK